MPFGYCAFGLMETHGGSPQFLLQPEMAVGGGSVGGPSSEHERIADI